VERVYFHLLAGLEHDSVETAIERVGDVRINSSGSPHGVA